MDNLTEITTQRQSKNGTRMFYCERTGCRYGSYASGYVRREVDTVYSRWDHDNHWFVKVSGAPRQYQLNKTFKPFKGYNNIGRERITCEQKRLELIKRRAKSYKGYQQQS